MENEKKVDVHEHAKLAASLLSTESGQEWRAESLSDTLEGHRLTNMAHLVAPDGCRWFVSTCWRPGNRVNVSLNWPRDVEGRSTCPSSYSDDDRPEATYAAARGGAGLASAVRRIRARSAEAWAKATARAEATADYHDRLEATRQALEAAGWRFYGQDRDRMRADLASLPGTSSESSIGRLAGRVAGANAQAEVFTDCARVTIDVPLGRIPEFTEAIQRLQRPEGS